MSDAGSSKRRSRVGRSLRGKLLLIVGLGVILPFAVVAIWTRSRLEHAGEQLLASQLDSSLASIGRVIVSNWAVHQGELMLLADNDAVRNVLRGPDRRFSTRESRFLREAYTRLQTLIDGVTFRDGTGVGRWRIRSDPGLEPMLEAIPTDTPPLESRRGLLAVTMPVIDEESGRALGSMTSLLRISALLPSQPMLVPLGSSLRVIDATKRTPVVMSDERSQFAHDETLREASGYVTVERRLDSPPLILVAASPVAPYVGPFARSARTGMIGMLTILGGMFVTAALLTMRATHSLKLVAAAADAVAHGDLERQIDVRSDDEIGRLAAAFNGMTRDLRRTLQESAQRKALAAVGEFAAQLAHEVRNPLTSVRLDLQRLAERLPAEGDLRERSRRVLSTIDRLNRTVTGALRLARSGNVALETLPLSAALEPAIEAALPEFAARGVSLERDATDLSAVQLHGDADALSQLFLNLLLNAAQATTGAGTVSISTTEQGGLVTVSVADTGPGISSDVMCQLDESFVTTKPGGTGLGLRIAHRIAAAHGGRIEFTSRPGSGTIAKVILARPHAADSV